MFGFNNKIKKELELANKKIEELENNKKKDVSYIEELQESVEKLSNSLKEFKDKQSTGALLHIPEEFSSLVFLINKDLSVSTKTFINDNIRDVLVDENYILSEQRDDMEAINLAFVVMASEVTEQLLEKVNEDARLVKEFMEENK